MTEKTDKQQSSIDPAELRERLRSVRGRFGEFRGRL